MAVEVRIEEKEIFWRIATKVEGAIRCEPVTAIREEVWGTDGVNPDGTYRFKVIGKRVRLRPVLDDGGF